MTAVIEKPIIGELFRPELRDRYDFSEAPTLVRMRSVDAITHDVSRDRMSAWARSQRIFMAWTRERGVFTAEAVRRGKEVVDRFFETHGPLRGSVLDIGGGWGLYRQWWSREPRDVFVVHDPGVARFRNGPHDLHREHFALAFSRPMTFVEGFGEFLPYRDESFNRCVIASALDHCLDPSRVLGEAIRCLKPGGLLIVLQDCHAEPRQPATEQPPSLLARLGRAIRSPGRALSSLWIRLRYPDVHLFHFRVAELRESLVAAGSPSVTVEAGPRGGDSFCFLARK
jgi:SAM-dependent methyltransferase